MEKFSHVCTRGDACFAQEQDSPLRSPYVGEWSEEEFRELDPEFEKRLRANKITLESEYEKIKDSTFDEWKNIRGPRPWEDPDLLQGRNPESLKTKRT
ncbi:cytochrome c oxidase assembly protein COX16 homolog, mitochondrial isoform X5 [Sapajus apella]|uniref:Cytochrome c oxidase assembly protein COX16 homolog, mitochondrial n=1 Tax=Sapajus apella TaxID=9515 RepID=A0A6J3F7K2_SAPAP|nr:cytochrome c oxidase assembly protein COX16 homolog, mitochondrial isoform X5 [Sapajus apella]